MEMIVTYREEITFLIPYGRVLSEIFSQLEIVKRVKRAGLIVKVEWSQKFEYVDSSLIINEIFPFLFKCIIA